MNNEIGIFVFGALIVVLVIFLLWFFIFKVKHLKTPDVYMVDGGVKTGKSLVTVKLAVRQYRKNCIKVAIFNFFRKIVNKFRKVKKAPLERPMLYSNMPLFKVKYNKLTLDILMWKYRIPYKSVCLIDEASLLADSMTGMQRGKLTIDKDKFDEVNETLTLFLKLYGHSTHGGSCFYNSQQVIDLHFAFKRCTSTYLFIAKNRKYPFFCLLDVRELVHDESGDVQNTFTKDVEIDDRPLFISKRWYKYYDRFYLDVLTKHLQTLVDYNVQKISYKDKKDLDNILTLGSFKKIKEYNDRVAQLQKPTEVKQDEKK